MTDSQSSNRPKSAIELYKQVPPLRRQDTCGKILVAHVIALFVIGYVPILFPIGALTSIGVIVVCIMTLTGPIYVRQLDYKRGVLQEWGIANKVAAVVILLLFVLGFGGLGYWIYR